MAADVFKCSICNSFQVLNLRILMNHVYTIHSKKDNFHIKCPVETCTGLFRLYNSLYKHVLSYYSELYHVRLPPEIQADSVSDYPTAENLESDHEENPLDIGSSSTEDQNSENEHADDGYAVDSMDSNESDNDASESEDESLQKNAALFLLRMKEHNKLSQVALESIRKGTETLVDQIQSKIINEIQLLDSISDESKVEICSIINDFNKPFIGLETEALHSRYVKENLHFVPFEEVSLGKKLVRQRENNKISIQEVDQCFIYIPIIKTIEQMLCNSKIRNLIIKQPSFAKDGVHYDICDGKIFKLDQYFNYHKKALALIFYNDELEVCNPLSSRAGIHKFDMYYFTVAKLTPKLRSKHCAVRLLGIAKASLIKKYGIDAVLKPIITDLKELYNGAIISINGKESQIFGKIVVCAGDTLGQHLLGGFKEGVGASFQKCRNCYCNFEQMQKDFDDDLFVERNKVQHEHECAFIERAPNDMVKSDLMKTFGITRRSLLLELPDFDITKQLPQDIMHTMLEGVGQYEARLVLLYFINHGNFSLKELNTAIEQHNYGYTETKDKPSPLREAVFNGDERYKLKYKAVQAWIFLRLLPFIVSPMVSTEDPYYIFLTEWMSIVSIMFSPVINERTALKLKSLIKCHLRSFVQLFPDKNILPKQHYMIHIPQIILDFGPPIRLSCFSFEAAHLYFKEVARKQNFKNLTQSLAKRHQLLDCSNFGDVSSNLKSHPLFSTERKLGVCKMVSNESIENLRNDLNVQGFLPGVSLKDIYSLSWVKLFGTKYCKNGIVIVSADPVTRQPVFGYIKSIWSIHEYIYIETILYETMLFSSSYHAYPILEKEEKFFISYDALVDYNVYHCKSDHNGNLYVPIKYYLEDIIEEHLNESTPLHE